MRIGVVPVVLTVVAMAIAGGCEKNVQEVRRPRRTADPYASIRGAPMGYSGDVNTGIRGTPGGFAGDVSSGGRGAPSAPSATPKAGSGDLVAPSGEARGGTGYAVTPARGARSADVVTSPAAQSGAPAAQSGDPAVIGGAPRSPTDGRR